MSHRQYRRGAGGGSPPMGEARRRREAAASTPIQRVSDAGKQKIADVVRSVHVVTLNPGGLCMYRAVAGMLALRALGIPAVVNGGGMLYRAGPDAVRDVCGFADAEGLGTFLPDGLLGHMWIEAAPGDLVDFSC